MSSNIIDTPIRPKFYRDPRLWAVINLLVALYGIVFQHWNLQPLVYLFWIEIIISLAAMLARVAGALQGRPFWDTILPRLGAVAFGTVMSILFIMLTVAFTFKAFESGFQTEGFGHIRWQMVALVLNYGWAVLFHYYLNGRFRQASPVGELMSDVVRLMIILVFLMVITQHLLPRYPELNAARWTAVAIVLLKFVADWVTARK